MNSDSTPVGGRNGVAGAGSDEPVVRLTVDIHVHDLPALLAFARKQYEASWGDEDWTPADLGELVYEAMIASNANPSPDVIGVEIGHFATETINEVPVG